jgi:hypothetical protein
VQHLQRQRQDEEQRYQDGLAAVEARHAWRSKAKAEILAAFFNVQDAEKVIDLTREELAEVRTCFASYCVTLAYLTQVCLDLHGMCIRYQRINQYMHTHYK